MKPGDINLWWLARIFRSLPFSTNYRRRLAYLGARDVVLKLLSWLVAFRERFES